MKTAALYAQLNERDFTAQVIQLARVFGWRTAHFRPAMTKRGRWVTPVQGDGAGFPDLLLLRHNRRIMAELKAAKGKVTPEQDAWLLAAKAAGFETYTWRPADIDEIERILDRGGAAMSDHEETAKRLIEKIYKDAGYHPQMDNFINAVAAALAQAEAEGAKGPWNKCPRCDSPNAHLHPAVQYEGEVQPCSHPFHIPAEITRLKAENLRLSHEGLLVEKQAAEAERDYFRARLAEVERERGCGCKTSEQTGTLNGYMCEWHREKYLQVCADRDAAEAKGVSMGLERAREIATDFSKPYEIDWWMTKTKKEISAIMCLDVADAIDAEIAKAGKEK